jgi:hypothetical protein
MPREIHTSSVTWYSSPQREASHNHQYVRTLRIRQTLGLDYATAASTSPSRDNTIVAPTVRTGFSCSLVGRRGPYRQT